MTKSLLSALFVCLSLAACNAQVNVQPQASASPSASPSASATPSSAPTVDPSIVFSGNFSALPSGSPGTDYNTAMFNNLSLTADRFNRANQAFRFSGADSFLRVNYDINPSKLPRVSLNLWARYENAEAMDNGIHTVISHDNANFDRTLLIDGRSGNWGWSAFAGDKGVMGAGTVTLNAWTMLTAVYDQPAKTVSLYVNGNLVKTQTDATLGEGFPFLLLGMNPGFDEFFKGSIDDLSIYNRALSATEVKALHTAQSVLR